MDRLLCRQRQQGKGKIPKYARGGAAMRKITRDAVNAFRNNEDFNRGNTQVMSGVNGAVMLLHGNAIAAWQDDGELYVSSAGWETVTTRDRLNGLLSSCGCQGIYQKDFAWYWEDGVEFGDGWQEARTCDVGYFNASL